MAEISYDITEKIGVIEEESKSGWTTEVNMVSWNGAKAKLDIRKWNHKESKMGKGLTLSDEAVEKLRELIL